MEAVRKLRQATLVFLVKREDSGAISEICLAMKKRGFGAGRWNGAGGKFDSGAGDTTIESAAIRETKEEIGSLALGLGKVAVFDFHFPAKPDWNQQVHAYFCENWQGEPIESEEMAPRWFAPANIPYNKMWPDDVFWLPLVLAGKKIKGKFSFGESDAILEQQLTEVESF